MVYLLMFIVLLKLDAPPLAWILLSVCAAIDAAIIYKSI